MTLGSAQSSLYNGMGGHHANPGCIVNGVAPSSGSGSSSINTSGSTGSGSGGQRTGRNTGSAETSGTSLTGSVLPVTAITTSSSSATLSLTNHLDSLTDTPPNKGRQGRHGLPFSWSSSRSQIQFQGLLLGRRCRSRICILIFRANNSWALFRGC